MARYIKANPLVARYLQLENERNTVSDGNYLFWQNDMLKFGPLTQLNDILVKIGGIALMPHEARSEQDGTICRPLPMATDARFQQPIKANVNDAIVGDNTNTERGEDGGVRTQRAPTTAATATRARPTRKMRMAANSRKHQRVSKQKVKPKSKEL